MIIKDCVDLLKNDFPDKWISNYEFDDANRDISTKRIIGKINSSLELLYEKFHFSLLSGEYIKSKSQVLEQIEILVGLLNEVNFSIEGLGATDQKSYEFLSHLIQSDYSLLLTESLRSYASFVRHINRKLDNMDSTILFDEVSSRKEFTSKVITGNDYFILFDCNLQIAEFDHELSMTQEALKGLLNEKRRLEYISTDIQKGAVYYPIILDKCHYLVKKILYRLSQIEESYVYSYGHEDRELSLEDPVYKELKYFKNFDEVTKIHYGFENSYKHKQEKRIDAVFKKTANNAPLEVKEFHTAVKVYKDDYKSPNQLKNLCKRFEEQYGEKLYSQEVLSFDQLAFKVDLIYVLNNELSSIIENITSETQILDKANRIIELQQTSRVKNYFLYFKLCTYLAQSIEEKFRLSDVNEDQLKLINSLVSRLENYMKDFQKNFEWCYKRNFLAFQLPFKESQLNTPIAGDGTISIFLASTFVLPINYEEVKNQIVGLNAKLLKFKGLIEFHEYTQSEKNTIKRVLKDTEDSTKKHIEILSIFAAIVLFTASSIQIFSKDITFKDGLKFMLCFSYSLVLFIFLIWLITRENIKSITIYHKIFFFALAATTIVSLCFTIGWWPK